ncbi:hypothetical protein B0H17DRAFT_202592 [Mycena rosella]|uniref:Uncharacterized protein n=1 Tax=Mycena rosella TaxID=1033263 RepID=A0AAD7CYN7_MYCRO|nr:hypothetical protein B0H17DRAFT_202592 [Mycena rosella]
MGAGGAKKKAVRVETHLERWVKALGELLKEEQRKYREKKKRVEKDRAAGLGKIRLSKSDFFRSLTTNLRVLRELDAEKRMFRVAAGEDVDSDEDDEYVLQKAPRAKKRRTA